MPRRDQDAQQPRRLLWNAIPTVFPLPLSKVTSRGRPPKRPLPSTEQEELEQGQPHQPPDKASKLEDYEMAALPTFGRDRLLAIARKQWHEIKRLRVSVRRLERTVVLGATADETFLLELLTRNLDGVLLDRVVDIIVGDEDDGRSEADLA